MESSNGRYILPPQPIGINPQKRRDVLVRHELSSSHHPGPTPPVYFSSEASLTQPPLLSNLHADRHAPGRTPRQVKVTRKHATHVAMEGTHKLSHVGRALQPLVPETATQRPKNRGRQNRTTSRQSPGRTRIQGRHQKLQGQGSAFMDMHMRQV